MILLRILRLNNFLSHENTEIIFKENEKLLIDGTSGAGKSSIFDAIIWCLYGHGRADNRNLIRRGVNKGYIYLQLQKDNELVDIKRTITNNGKHTLEVNICKSGEKMVAHPLTNLRDLQNWIDTELIGASYTLFINSVAYIQDNENTFVSQPATKRKELLLEIIKADNYDKYYEQARKRLAELTIDKNRLIGQLTELESRRGQLKASLYNKQDLESSVIEYKDKQDEVSRKREELETRRAQNITTLNQIKHYEDRIKQIKNEIIGLEKDIHIKRERINKKYEYQKIIDDGREIPELLNGYKTTLRKQRELFITYNEQDEIRQKLLEKKPLFIDLTTEIEETAKQIEILRKRPICPSGDACPYQNQVNVSIESGEKKIVELVTRNSENVAKLAVWKKEFEALPVPGDKKTLLNEMQENEITINRLESEIRKIEMAKQEIESINTVEQELPIIETKINTLNKEIEDINEAKEKLEEECKAETLNKWTMELARCHELEQEFTQKIAEVLSMLKKIEQDLAEIESIDKRIIDIHGNKLATIDLHIKRVAAVKEAFGSNGIKTMVIDYLIPRLEDRINKILSELSDFRIRLDTQRKTADGEGIVEGLFIILFNEMNEEIPFENLSGGEKMKVSVAISEALATLQKCNFRLFDEFATALDSNSLEGFMSSIIHLQKQYPQMLMISHIQEIKDLFEEQGKIIKKNGISTIESVDKNS